MVGLSLTSLISLLVARRTLLFLSLIFGLWLSLPFRWFSRSQLFSLVCFVVCTLPKAFALSAIICLGVIGCKTHVLSSHLNVYMSVRPSWVAPLSNCQGRPSNIWHTVNGTT